MRLFLLISFFFACSPLQADGLRTPQLIYDVDMEFANEAVSKLLENSQYEKWGRYSSKGWHYNSVGVRWRGSLNEYRINQRRVLTVLSKNHPDWVGAHWASYEIKPRYFILEEFTHITDDQLKTNTRTKIITDARGAMLNIRVRSREQMFGFKRALRGLVYLRPDELVSTENMYIFSSVARRVIHAVYSKVRAGK